MVQYLVAPGDSEGEGTDMNYPELPTSPNVSTTDAERGAAVFGDIWARRNSVTAETPLNGVSSDVRERTGGHFEKMKWRGKTLTRGMLTNSREDGR